MASIDDLATHKPVNIIKIRTVQFGNDLSTAGRKLAAILPSAANANALNPVGLEDF
jgi:hypothetical protein